MRRWKSALFAAAVLGLNPGAAAGWFSTGHMITAQIAYDELDAGDRQEVDRLIGVLAEFDPKLADFVSAATWMDDIKGYGLYVFNEWHYYNAPINAAGLDSFPPPRSEDVVWAIQQATSTLVDPKARDLQKALALRFLIHFVGDVHQPLHCSTRFSEEFPQGDKGGNSFALASQTVTFAVSCQTSEPIPPTTIGELHELWDNTLDLYPAIDPLKNPSLVACIPQFAGDVTAWAPKSKVPTWTETDPESWARESFQLASTAYTGIEENTLPSNQYLAAGQPIVRHRLALGGYRLGALLDCIFSEQNQSCLGSSAGSSQRPH